MVLVSAIVVVAYVIDDDVVANKCWRRRYLPSSRVELLASVVSRVGSPGTSCVEGQSPNTLLRVYWVIPLLSS